MRLDTTYLQYITKEELRVLLAVEMGMRNHEYVPVHLVENISKLKRANAFKVLQLLLKNKLIAHCAKKYDGYKLTYLGYDYLALSAFFKRGHVVKIIGKMGVGKESDIYKCLNSDGHLVVLKFARLGRTSFRTIKNNRDYLKHRTSFNWLYLSRLASVKEYLFMQVLYANKFPTPRPIDWNRHGVVMSLVDGYTMCNIKEVENTEELFNQCVTLLERLAQNGLIHSDFNEFNLMVTHEEKLMVIDFPQMVSTSHPNADFYFQRDQDCINTFFTRRFKYNKISQLQLQDIKIEKNLDIEVKASGFLKKELNRQEDLDILDNYEELKDDEEQNSNDSLLQDDTVNDDNEENQFVVNEGLNQQDLDQDDYKEEEKQEQMENSQEEIEKEIEDENEIKIEKEIENENENEIEEDELTIEEIKALRKEKKKLPKKQKEQQILETNVEKPKQQEEEQVMNSYEKQFIQKIVTKKYRNKLKTRKNPNKKKDRDLENEVEDVYFM